MKVAVGIKVAPDPPHGSARALLSACGSYLRSAAKWAAGPFGCSASDSLIPDMIDGFMALPPGIFFTVSSDVCWFQSSIFLNSLRCDSLGFGVPLCKQETILRGMPLRSYVWEAILQAVFLSDSPANCAALFACYSFSNTRFPFVHSCSLAKPPYYAVSSRIKAVFRRMPFTCHLWVQRSEAGLFHSADWASLHA
jgi:hypothetical protein